jgi:hypothetical protein
MGLTLRLRIARARLTACESPRLVWRSGRSLERDEDPDQEPQHNSPNKSGNPGEDDRPGPRSRRSKRLEVGSSTVGLTDAKAVRGARAYGSVFVQSAQSGISLFSPFSLKRSRPNEFPGKTAPLLALRRIEAG